jgi:hypothetical protein
MVLSTFLTLDWPCTGSKNVQFCHDGALLMRNFVLLLVQMIKSSFGPLSLETCGPWLEQLKMKFQILVLWYSIEQENHSDNEDTLELQFQAFVRYWPKVIIRPKS